MSAAPFERAGRASDSRKQDVSLPQAGVRMLRESSGTCFVLLRVKPNEQGVAASITADFEVTGHLGAAKALLLLNAYPCVIGAAGLEVLPDCVRDLRRNPRARSSRMEALPLPCET